MAYRLSRGETVLQGALRLVDEELRAAVSELRRSGDPHERVHSARKAIKRARAVLRLVRAGLGPCFERDNVLLRDAARRLSGPRDAAVAALAFSQLVPEPAAALLPIRDALAAARDAAGVPSTGDALALAAGELERVARERTTWPTFAHGWSVIAAGLTDSYARGRKAMREALADPTPEAFHEWRKRVKDLWYHTLLLQGVWKNIQTAAAEALEDLSDILGEDHDLEVLRHAVAVLPDLAPAARRELHALADDRSSELRTAAATLGQRIYAERPRRYLARMRHYWQAWRSDERRANEARRVADAHPARPAAPPSEVVLPPDREDTPPPDQDPQDRSQKPAS